MFVPLGAMLATTIVLVAADGVPTFNVEPSCRAAAERAVPVGDPKICMQKELDARDQLAKDWANFTGSDKATCVPLSRTGGTPTYTELLTCLEMTRDARKIPNDRTRTTTGQGTR